MTNTAQNQHTRTFLQSAVDMLSTLVFITLRLTCNPVFHLYHETNKQKNQLVKKNSSGVDFKAFQKRFRAIDSATG